MSITAGGTGFSGVWTNVYIIRKFVDMLKQELLFAKFSEPAMIPKNTGGYVARWNIPKAFSGSTTVITEASAGTVGEQTSTEIAKAESTINTYGQWMKVDKPWVWECEIVYSRHDFIPTTAEAIFPIPYD